MLIFLKSIHFQLTCCARNDSDVYNKMIPYTQESIRYDFRVQEFAIGKPNIGIIFIMKREKFATHLIWISKSFLYFVHNLFDVSVVAIAHSYNVKNERLFTGWMNFLYFKCLKITFAFFRSKKLIQTLKCLRRQMKMQYQQVSY